MAGDLTRGGREFPDRRGPLAARRGLAILPRLSRSGVLDETRQREIVDTFIKALEKALPKRVRFMMNVNPTTITRAYVSGTVYAWAQTCGLARACTAKR